MAEILGKDLDLYDDSMVADKPFNLAESDITGPRFITGEDLARSTRISKEWKDPVAIPAQASVPYMKVIQPLVVGTRAMVDSIANIMPNMANAIAQTSLEVMEGEEKKPELTDSIDTLNTITKPLVKILGVGLWAADIDRKELMERAKTYDEAISLLESRDYPSHNIARRVIANTTADVESRRAVRELYRQAGNIDSSKWYNKAGEIIGAMVPALTIGKGAFGTARAFGASRLAASRIAQNIAKGYIGVEMGGQYAEETAAQYLERTGDKKFENFTASDATGITAMAYGAIGAQIEMMGGVEPIFAGALNKVGLKSGLLKAGTKIGAGEAAEELLQGLTETLMRKIDGSSNKTWREGFMESLNSAVWGLFIGGSLGTASFHVGRANLVKGIKQAFPNITDTQAGEIANVMIENTAEVSSQDPALRSNLRQKVALMYRDIDIENKEDIIDATTDLEYGLIAMDSAERGIDIAENPIFAGEVNELGWFRDAIPENRRAEITALNDEVKGLKEQLAEENKKEEKNWAKIDELESKLAQVNEYVLDKLSDLARNDAMAVRRMLRETEQKFVNKEKKRAKKRTKESKELFVALPDEKFDIKADHSKPYNYTHEGDKLSYYDDGKHHVIELLDDKGNVLSAIEINKTDNGVNYIQTLDKENWHKGYGTKVLKEAERLFGDTLVAKPSPDEWAQGFWKKNQYTEPVKKGLVKKALPVETEITEPTEQEEQEAIKEAEDVKDGTITSGTPENPTENIIQDYGEKIEGAKKDMVWDTEKSTKPEKTSINKIMEKAPQHEEERKILEDWLQKQDPEFVENIRQLNLPIKVWKSNEYEDKLKKAYQEHPELKEEQDYFDVVYGWKELSPETLEKLGITPSYRFTFVYKKNFYQELTPENVANYIGGRSAIKFTYQKSTDGNLYLWGKKGNNGSWLPLIKFETKEDMDAHKASHEQADLEKIYNEMTTYKPTAEKIIRERVGADYRQGKNITEKEFAEKFGFRGVQFGNYEKNEKRQKEINNSYDSFLDLANILNLPPEAISLGGTLGIAFGARGSGSAAAHYEPDLKVINITRDSGAGALAHEWFHALDNYLAQNLSQYANMAGGGFITKSDNYYYYKVNQELADSLKEYIRAIKGEKDFQLRLRQLGQYWKRDWEVGARLFEQYVSSKIALQNGINDYLANPQEYYTSATPYLTAEEASRVFPKLENMLNSIKTREEDGNVVLYQSGFASMRGELEGGALDAERFEGVGEGSSVWGWGSYLLKSEKIDKAHYYDPFNWQGKPISYEGNEIKNMFLSDFVRTDVEYGLKTEKSKEDILASLEKTLNANKNEVERKNDYIYMRLENKIPRHKITEILQDVYKLTDMEGVFYTKYPKGSIADDIINKYKPQGENPEGKRFTDDFLNVVEAVGLAYGGLDNANIFRNNIKDIELDIETFKNMDFNKIKGRTGFTFKGQPILNSIREQVLKHLPQSYASEGVEKQVLQVIRDAVIKGKNISEALLKEYDTEKSEMIAGADRYKERMIKDHKYTEQQKKVLDDIFEILKLGGNRARDTESLQKIENIEKGKYTRDLMNTELWQDFSKFYRDFSFGFGTIENGAQKAKAIHEVAKFFKNADLKDFDLRTNASMYKFDVPENKYLLDFTKTLAEQSKFVKDAIAKLYEETGLGEEPYNYTIKAINPKLPRIYNPNEILKEPKSHDDVVKTYDGIIDTFVMDWKNHDLNYAKKELDSLIARQTYYAQEAKDTIKRLEKEKKTLYENASRMYYVNRDIEYYTTSSKTHADYRDVAKFVKKKVDKIPEYANLKDYADITYDFKYDETGWALYKSIQRSFQLTHDEKNIKLAKELNALNKEGNIRPQKATSKLLEKYGIKGVKYEGERDKTGFVIFGKVPALERLYQNRVSGAGPRDYRGAYIPAYRFIQRANRMDASTLSHELAHDWMEVNFDRFRSGKATPEFMKAWGALEKALGIDENATQVPRKASETFARAYEAWIMTNEDWSKFINIEDKDKEAVEKLLKDYQGELRNIYNDMTSRYFKDTWGKLGELKPELKAWFDRAVNITDLDVKLERGEITEEQAAEERLNRAIDKVIETTTDEETANTLRTTRLLNDTARYEVEGGNKNSLQNRLSALAREIDENNTLLKKDRYNTRRDMMQVAEAADNFVKTRLDDALAIINGEMAEVEGLYKEDIYTALERLAIENGDMGLITELKNSEIANRLAKELGQRVAGFRNWKQSDDIDILSALKSTDNIYNKALENKKAKEQFNSALDLFDEELKNQDKKADADLDLTLNDLECK